MKQYKILGVRVESASIEDILDLLDDKISQNKSACISTVNNEFIVEAQSNTKFKNILNASNLNTIDSTGVKWAIKRKYREEVSRISGSDLIYDICSRAATKGYRIFLLGSDIGVGTAASKNLIKKYKGLHIVGVNEGNYINESKIDQGLINEINATNSDIVFVALGAPKQEVWISNNMSLLKPAIFIGVGGTLDYVSGKTKRAPKIMRNIGLEWLFRLFVQPMRLKRILKATIVFPLMVIFNKDTDKST